MKDMVATQGLGSWQMQGSMPGRLLGASVWVHQVCSRTASADKTTGDQRTKHDESYLVDVSFWRGRGPLAEGDKRVVGAWLTEHSRVLGPTMRADGSAPSPRPGAFIVLFPLPVRSTYEVSTLYRYIRTGTTYKQCASRAVTLSGRDDAPPAPEPDKTPNAGGTTESQKPLCFSFFLFLVCHFLHRRPPLLLMSCPCPHPPFLNAYSMLPLFNTWSKRKKRERRGWLVSKSRQPASAWRHQSPLTHAERSSEASRVVVVGSRVIPAREMTIASETCWNCFCLGHVTAICTTNTTRPRTGLRHHCPMVTSRRRGGEKSPHHLFTPMATLLHRWADALPLRWV